VARTPADAPPPEGEGCYRALQARARKLGQQYALVGEHPRQALAQWLLRHLGELFVFVFEPEVRADTNVAERSIRPVVVQGKISGGSRSAAGSSTRTGLASLCGTWMARGLSPFAECLKLLRHLPIPKLLYPKSELLPAGCSLTRHRRRYIMPRHLRVLPRSK